MADVSSELLAKSIFTFLVISHEKLIRPFEDCLSGLLSPLQLNALAIIANYPLMNMSELADRLSTTKQQATQIVNRLVELELVERRFDLMDRRVIKVAATERGTNTLDENVRKFCERFYQGLAALEPSQQARLRDAILVLNELLPHFGPQGAVRAALAPPGAARKYL